MARPNDSTAIANHVRGLREAKAAFQAVPEAMRKELNIATRDTVKAVTARARAILQSSPSIQTRNLYNAVSFTMNDKNGRGKAGIANVTSTVSQQPGRVGKATVRVKGIVIPGKTGGALGGRLDKPSRRAHFVEFGTRKMPAEPFMIPATEAEKGPYLSRCQAAGRRAEVALAHGAAKSGGGASGTGLL